MRVVVIGPSPPLRGGIAQHTAGIAEALTGEGHDVRVLGYSRQYPQLLFPGRSQYDGGVTVGDPVVDVLSPASWRRTLDQVVAYDADRVVVQWWHPVAAPALSWILARVHGPVRTLICHNARPHEWFPAWRTAMRRVLSNVDEVVCHSDYVARGIRGLVAAAPPLRLTAMPLLPRLDETELSGVADTKRDRAVRQVLFVGHIRPYKGVDRLLRAWPQRDRRRPAALLIVGEVYSGRRKLDRLVRRICSGEDILWDRRYVSDSRLLALVAACDVLVLPYRHASQSGLIPIARALGAPVVVTGAGGLREQADMDGSGGVAGGLSDSDVSRLAAALDCRIAEEPRSSASRHEALRGYGVARRQSWGEFCRALLDASGREAKRRMGPGL